MKICNLMLSVAASGLALTVFGAEGLRSSPSESLWYAQPAGVVEMEVPWAAGKTPCGNLPGVANRDPWESQSLPVGNGRLGGTVFGGDRRDRVNLNEVSLWSGGPNLPGNGSGYAYGPTSGKDQFGSYQPFGNLFAEYDLSGQTSDYTRSLDLRQAIARTEFVNGGVRHQRMVFASRPDDVLVYAARVDKPGALTAKVGLVPCHDVAYTIEGDTIVMRGTLANGEVFEGRLSVRIADGKGKASVVGGAKTVQVTYEGRGDGTRPAFDPQGIPYFQVTGATGFDAFLALGTDYKEDFKANWKGEDPAKRNQKAIAGAKAKSLKQLRTTHVSDHGALYRRMSLDLGKTDPETAKLPTDKRLAKYRQTLTDPELEALVYQYGRYVLIAGSRPGNLPLNLQGIWNDKVHAAWACDYHNNINLQMCYWGAEVANLSECHLTFLDFIRAMEEPLHNMTVKNFGPDKKGWTTRISQNPWGGGGWVKWNPPVNAWYALHLWDHYQYTQDRAYLATVGYPALKEICAFWETMLKEAPDGKLVSPQGWSHEWGPVEDGVSHDQQLIWELFDNTVKAASILGVDKDWTKKIADIQKRLDMPRVSPNGYLQEWREDRPQMVSGHRHTSHLIGVFPGTMLWNQPNTKDLIPAAEKSLDLRGCGGDNRRSWTWPWRTALWARFHKADRAYEMVQSYIRWNCLDNLFGNHPPMQMDGTYGMTGGMSEILVQSHAGQIELLPALPPAWKTGSVKGIRARGNVTVDMSWKDGKVESFVLTTSEKKPKPVAVLVNGEKRTVTPKVAGRK